MKTFLKFWVDGYYIDMAIKDVRGYMKYNQPVTIVHLITTLDVGGAEMMLFKLLSRMNRAFFCNYVVSLSSNGAVGKEISDSGIPVYSLGMPGDRLTLKGITKLWRLLRFYRPSVLQTWLYHADLLGFMIGKSAGTKTICWNIRCSNMELYERNLSSYSVMKFCSLLAPFPDAIVTNSRQAKEFHRSLGYRAKTWKIIPNGFDLKKFRPDENARADLLEELGLSYDASGTVKNSSDDFLIFIGLIARFAPVKDHETFIKAACLLIEDRPEAHFIMAGKGVEPQNESLIRQIPGTLLGHFHLLGERSDIPRITAALDIACLTSAYGEGFPNTVGEAMACGIPCVVTDVGDSARIVADTGIVVPPKDHRALAAAWEKLIDLKKEGRKKLGLAARERISNHFELSRVVEQYEELYSELVINEKVK